MRLPWPAISFTEKIIQFPIVQGFLRVFRDTQDIHRVLAVIPWALYISHSWFMKSAPQISLAAARFSNDEILWLFLASFPVLFVFCWAVFSSPFNPSLYVRQSIFLIWTVLVHRWFYGLEAIGTPFLTTVSLVALTSYLPFAFWGLRPDQLFKRALDEYTARKKAEPAVQMVPAQKSESEAA